jgi:hypothetical protein
MAMPRICLLVGATGSLSLTEAVTAARQIADPVLVLDRGELAASPALAEVASSLATTVAVDMSDFTAVCECVAASGADAVAAFVDAYCPVVDEVNARLFGRVAPPGRWRKDVQRELLVRHGVSRITNSPVRTTAELDRATARHRLPVVIKPVSGVASRDVWLLTSPAELAAFRAAVRLDGESVFVVEPYIRGPRQARGPHRADYLSAELFVTSAGTDGFLTDRPPLAAPCRETGIIGPSTLDAAAQTAVMAKARAAHQALCLGPGAYHIEIKLTDAEPEVIEVNGRLGGYVSRLVRLGTGADLALVAIGAVLDRPVLDRPMLDQPVLDRPAPFRPQWRRHVAALFLQAPMDAVRVAAAPGRREIRRLPGVLAVDHITAAGTPLDWRAGTGAAAVKVWLAGDDDDELRVAMAGCARWLTGAFDFRDARGRPARDDDWLAGLAKGCG